MFDRMFKTPSALTPSTKTLLVAVFIEGFCSIGAEVLALRQLIPHVGSSIVVTAPTIGFFLLALAFGYNSGGKVAENFVAIVARNFLLSAAFVAVGLAGNSIDTIFKQIQPVSLAYLVFIGGILCPVAWLLGQTVPILTNIMRHERTGQKAGVALYWSTLGSFLGSLTLSLAIMQWLGVSAAVVLVAVSLFVGGVILRPVVSSYAICLVGIAVTAVANQRMWVIGETAYSTYAVEPLPITETIDAKAFKVNNSISSIIVEGDPAFYARYIHRMRQLLLGELNYEGRDILVLGAGGFTLSHNEPSNRYVYVDIDPAIQKVAEEHFLKDKARGEFIAEDARRYVKATDRKFDAVVVDVYSARMSIPAHLIAREFWLANQQVLKPNGVMLANLILDSKLESPYARNLLATIESVYGRCGVEVAFRGVETSNVVVVCFKSEAAQKASIYSDELNRGDADLIRAN